MVAVSSDRHPQPTTSLLMITLKGFLPDEPVLRAAAAVPTWWLRFFGGNTHMAQTRWR